MTNQSPIWIYYENIATHEQLLPPERLDGLSKTIPFRNTYKPFN